MSNPKKGTVIALMAVLFFVASPTIALAQADGVLAEPSIIITSYEDVVIDNDPVATVNFNFVDPTGEAVAPVTATYLVYPFRGLLDDETGEPMYDTMPWTTATVPVVYTGSDGSFDVTLPVMELFKVEIRMNIAEGDGTIVPFSDFLYITMQDDDPDPPIIDQLIVPTELYFGEPFTVSMHAYDELSGIVYMSIFVEVYYADYGWPIGSKTLVVSSVVPVVDGWGSLLVPFDQIPMEEVMFNPVQVSVYGEVRDGDDEATWDSRTCVSGGYNMLPVSSRSSIDDLVENLETLTSSATSWKSTNLEDAMISKIAELGLLFQDGAFSEAYDKLLHDIKPKLTGLKVDENGNPFGNGVFNNPWLTNVDEQTAFTTACNDILAALNELF
jgi:hypothetical protein